MLFLCWATVSDVGPTSKQNWVKISCSLDALRPRVSCALLPHPGSESCRSADRADLRLAAGHWLIAGRFMNHLTSRGDIWIRKRPWLIALPAQTLMWRRLPPIQLEVVRARASRGSLKMSALLTQATVAAYISSQIYRCLFDRCIACNTKKTFSISLGITKGATQQKLDQRYLIIPWMSVEVIIF